MNYNNYNNGYYNPYSTNPYAYYQNNMYQPQQPIQQPVQKSYLPMVFVNGIEGAKAYLLDANQMVYLKDSDSDLLFEKSTDMNGKPTLKAFKVVPTNLDSNGKEVISNNNIEYVTKNDIASLQEEFNKSLDKLSNDIKELFNKGE